SYTYDTWGKLISISGSLKDTVGVLNPYRYRGYRYDTETGLYYLQSRYYNPEWGRFINADGIAATPGELLSANMYAYCKNNPVNMSDADGDRPEFSGTGRDTGDDLAVSLAIMNHRYDYSTGTISKSGSSLRYARMNDLGKGWDWDANNEKWQQNQDNIIGLSGKALIIYLIISEGSRVIPPRNLIPVP
ncbi:RHS repeat-associated core domain-containing protein, partial [Clostridium guangxiense]